MHLKQNLIGCDRYSELPACGDGWRGRQNPIRSTGFHSTVWKCQPDVQWIVSSIIVQNLKKIMIMVNCILFCIIILFFHTCLILFAFSLTYTPCRDCAGVEYLNITMYENQTDPEIPPANSTDVIIINIQSINDPPIPFAAYNGKLLLMDDITEPIVVGILFIWFFLDIIKVLF